MVCEVSNSGPGNCGTITGSRLSQRVGVLDHGVDALLLVPVERLKHEWSLALSCASRRSRSKCLLRCRQSFACSWLCSFVSFPRAHPCCWVCSIVSSARAHPCCWVCSFTPAVGPLFSTPQCRPPITSSGFFASLSVILPSSAKVSGFLSWGSSATVMITQFVDLVQVLIVAAASCSHGDPRADLCVFHALHDVLMAIHALLGELFARARTDSVGLHVLRVVCWTDQHHAVVPLARSAWRSLQSSAALVRCVHVAVLLQSAHIEGLSAGKPLTRKTCIQRQDFRFGTAVGHC